MTFNEEKLLFEYKNSILYKIVFGFIWLIGVALMMFAIFLHQHEGILSLKLIGVSLFLLSGSFMGFYNSYRYKNCKASQVYFDNANRVFIINQINNENFKIAYSEIDKLSVLKYVSHINEGFDEMNSSHRYIVYKVLIIFKDDSKWELYRSTMKKEADDILDILNAKINLQKSQEKGIIKPRLPSSIQNIENNLFEWKSKKTFFEIFNSIVLAGSMAIIGNEAANSFYSANTSQIITYIIIIILAIIFLLIFNSSQQQFNVKITQDNILYNKKNYFSKSFKTQQLPLKDLAKIRFNYDLDVKNSIEKNRIMFLTKNIAEKIKNIDNGNEGSIFNVFSLIKELLSNSISLETFNISIVDTLTFKSILQYEIDKKTQNN